MQMLGTNFTAVTAVGDDDEFPLGTIGEDSAGKRYVYCEAGGAIGDAVAVKLSDTTSPFNDVVVSGASGPIIGVNTTGSAIADEERFWLQVSGVVVDANVATGLTAGAILSFDSDANGDFQQISATSATDAVHTPRAMLLEDEAAGVADVLLFALL